MEIHTGMKFTSKWFNGECEVMSFNGTENTLQVLIKREKGQHSEEWNLQHTAWGFQQGDYTLIK